jgi:HEPN domain-containing protein
MNAYEKYGYWLDSAQYDLDSADAMYTSGRWLYVVVMCQQAVEKLVKGLYVLYVNDNVPKTHDISTLIRSFENQLSEPVTSARYDLFDKLRSFYINGRYTDYKQKMSISTEKQTAETYLAQTKEVFLWLLTQKP